MDKYILVIDSGTTGVRSLIFNSKSQVKALAYTEFPNYHPSFDRVEQDANEIWHAIQEVIQRSLAQLSIHLSDIQCIGITNQRATTVIWDKITGLPVTRAIVWQDTRTASRVSELSEEWADKVYSRTGWPLAPVYSALSIEWVFNTLPHLHKRAQEGKLAFGTVDSWLIYCLTGGEKHVISASNASVTGCYDLINNQWYEEWLNALNIPLSIFPRICDDSAYVASTNASIMGASVPISGVIADQHAALFAQECVKPGMVKCTHGTGTFLDMNIGNNPIIDTKSGIACQLAWRKNGQTTYALEGYAGYTGEAIQWLRDNLKIINASVESEELALSVEDSGGVYFVPAFTGLAAPSWDTQAKGAIFGISPSTTKGHIARATIEGIVYSIKDFIHVMKDISGFDIQSMAVDGGAAQNDLLVQFQADQLGFNISRPQNIEATSLGAALMAGLAMGIWKDEKEAFAAKKDTKKIFRPQLDDGARDSQYAKWTRAVECTRLWSKK